MRRHGERHRPDWLDDGLAQDVKTGGMKRGVEATHCHRQIGDTRHDGAVATDDLRGSDTRL